VGAAFDEKLLVLADIGALSDAVSH
jgi:hypothetical protein